MQFEVEHTIRIPYDQYFPLVLSEEFNDWVKKRLKQDVREIVLSEEIDGELHRTVRSERDLSERARKYLKVPRLIVEDRQVIQIERGSYSWEFVPNVGIKRFSAKGTGRIEPAGDYLKRYITGDLRFKIALVGKRIERRMVEGIKKNITRVGDSLEDYYRKHHQA